jgi:hypothetical protein
MTNASDVIAVLRSVLTVHFMQKRLYPAGCYAGFRIKFDRIYMIKMIVS